MLLLFSLVGALLASARGASTLRRPVPRVVLRPYPFIPLELDDGAMRNALRASGRARSASHVGAS